MFIECEIKFKKLFKITSKIDAFAEIYHVLKYFSPVYSRKKWIYKCKNIEITNKDLKVFEKKLEILFEQITEIIFKRSINDEEWHYLVYHRLFIETIKDFLIFKSISSLKIEINEMFILMKERLKEKKM